jgi:hypothetical protein
MMTSENSSIRLAAFLDGEGCISSSIAHTESGGLIFNVAVMIDNTDIRLPLWCKENFGGSVYSRQPKQNRHRMIHRWQITGEKAAKILQLCMPHFLLKKEQAEIAIALIKTLKKDGNPHSKEVWQTRTELTEKLRVLKGRLPKVAA